MVHLVTLADTPPQPWRNGGGATRELLAWPPGGEGDWQLRVSVADIDRDGPFSPFPGVARCFAVLEGAGVLLSLPDGEQRLTPASAPLAFDGAAAPGCRLIDGPTRDLNLMARHTAGVPRMHAARAGEPLAPATGRRWLAAYTTGPAWLGVGDGTPHALPAGGLAWAEAPAGAWRLQPAGPAPLRAWWLTLDAPAARTP